MPLQQGYPYGPYGYAAYPGPYYGSQYGPYNYWTPATTENATNEPTIKSCPTELKYWSDAHNVEHLAQNHENVCSSTNCFPVISLCVDIYWIPAWYLHCHCVVPSFSMVIASRQSSAVVYGHQGPHCGQWHPSHEKYRSLATCPGISALLLYWKHSRGWVEESTINTSENISILPTHP